MRQSGTSSGKVFDPVFAFMVVAVGLAVASSFALRAVVAGMGPAAAHAAEGPLDLPADQPADQAVDHAAGQEQIAGAGGVGMAGQPSPAMAAGTSR